jgi:hypothetical protein
MTWDADHRQVARQNALGRIWTSVLDQLNRVRATVDPVGHRVSTSSDAASRVIAVVNGTKGDSLGTVSLLDLGKGWPSESDAAQAWVDQSCFGNIFLRLGL